MPSPEIALKRVYEHPSRADGLRVLVDRIWPRGVSKDSAQVDVWAKDIAPSSDLRKWFNHVPERFRRFSKLYQDELKARREQVEKILKKAAKRKLTLVYAARDPVHNNAVVLKHFMDGVQGESSERLLVGRKATKAREPGEHLP